MLGLLERAWGKGWYCLKRHGGGVRSAGESVREASRLLEKALGLLEKGVEIVLALLKKAWRK